jgi:hypothetical protein
MAASCLPFDKVFVMTRFFRRLAASLFVSLGFAAPASATIHSIDFTDIWYIPAEAGWGLNLIQQGDTLFGTLFVYGEDRSPRWYVGSNLAPQTAVAGTNVFKSPLYRTTGTYFGTVPFDAAGVTLDQVGEMTLTFSSPTSGTLVYNVGSVTVTKTIQRQSFRADPPTGNFIGGFSLVASACADPAQNGPFPVVGQISGTVAAGNAATLRLEFGQTVGQAFCTMTGTLITQGKLASIVNGTWSCSVNGSTPVPGPFSITSLDIQVNGIHGNFQGTDQSCTYNGRIGGVRSVN